MPLGGTGAALGTLLAGAVGAPGVAGAFFQTVGAVVAAWAPENVIVNAGAMAAVGGAVSGLGTFTVGGSKEDLGGRIATALGIPPTATDTRAVWIAFAGALIDHFNGFGKANGTGLTSGNPCGGAGKVQWTSAVFVPPLAVQMSVAEPVAAGLIEAFGTQLFAHIQTNASVVSASLSGPPLSAPSDGPVTGTGTIA